MSTFIAYIFLFIAVLFGTLSNTFAKNSEGFVKFFPSILSMVTIILCMYSLSRVMKILPVGITYASFAGLCIIATIIVGMVKFHQIPNIYSLVGIIFIISGVLLVNLLGQN